MPKQADVSDPIGRENPQETVQTSVKRCGLNRQKRKESETPEEAAARRLKASDGLKKRYIKNKAKETPEEAAARRLKNLERTKKYLENKKAKETTEETAERLLKQTDYRRRRRELQKQANSKCCDEVLARRRLQYKEKLQRQKESETPEEAAARRLKASEKLKKKYALSRANETPEEAAKRRLKERNNKRRLRQTDRHLTLEVENETAEQTSGRERSENETETEAIVSNDPIVKYENIDDELDGSCTFSSFGASETSYSRTSIEGSCSITSTTTRAQTIGQSNADAPSDMKSEPSRDNGFFFEIFEMIKSGESANESTAPAVVQDIIVKEEVDL